MRQNAIHLDHWPDDIIETGVHHSWNLALDR
jgi:hypothetical protein